MKSPLPYLPLILLAAPATLLSQGFGGFGPPPGRGGFGGGPQQSEDIAILKTYDRNGDGWLDTEERQSARQDSRLGQGGGGFRGGRGGFGGQGNTPRTEGRPLSPGDVTTYPASVPLYDAGTLRTIFIEFENKTDWEQELAAFNNTDVDVPATVTVDGKTYPKVGIHFRGMSSFFMVPATEKRSLNLSFDMIDEKQELLGYKTLNLLNSHEDPSYLRSVLYYQVSRDYLPAPKANFVRVVINGTSWGIFVNVQQFNKEFVKEWYPSTKGARWKAPGSPNGQASWAYWGDNVDTYRGSYEIKSKDDPDDWARLINVFKVLNQTPADRLKDALEPILDVDGALRFLALDNALINNDGYWIRSSDYVLYLDDEKVLHIFPQDANETFSIPGGPGFGGGRRGGGGSAGVTLDPLVLASDGSKPLASKLLAVPEYRQKYLGYVRDIAQKWLDWDRLGPIAEQYRDLIRDEMKIDTRMLDTFEDFENSFTEDISGGGGPGPSTTIGLKNFADQRRAYLLNRTEDL